MRAPGPQRLSHPQAEHTARSDNPEGEEGLRAQPAQCDMLVLGSGSDRILGFTMLGPEAGEVMTVVQMAILTNMIYKFLYYKILTHPTMAAGLGSLFANVSPTATQSHAHS